MNPPTDPKDRENAKRLMRVLKGVLTNCGYESASASEYLVARLAYAVLAVVSLAEPVQEDDENAERAGNRPTCGRAEQAEPVEITDEQIEKRTWRFCWVWITVWPTDQKDHRRVIHPPEPYLVRFPVPWLLRGESQ